MKNTKISKPNATEPLAIFNWVEEIIQQVFIDKNHNPKKLEDVLVTQDKPEWYQDLVKKIHADISSLLNDNQSKHEFNLWVYNASSGEFKLNNGTMTISAMEDYIKKYWLLLCNHRGVQEQLPENYIESVSIKVVDYMWKKDIPIIQIRFAKEENLIRDKYVWPILRVALPKKPKKVFPQVYSTWKWETFYDNSDFNSDKELSPLKTIKGAKKFLAGLPEKYKKNLIEAIESIA